MSCCNQHTYFDQYKVAGARKAMFDNTAYYKQIHAYKDQPQVIEGFQTPRDVFSTQAALATPPAAPTVVSLGTSAGAPINALPPTSLPVPVDLLPLLRLPRVRSSSSPRDTPPSP